MTKKFPALIAALLAAISIGAGPRAQAEDALSPPQQTAVEKIVHDYLLAHPEVLMEALQKADDQAAAAQKATTQSALDQHREELTDDPAAPILGNPKGDVTLVEFFDYQCPYCKQAAAIVDQLIRKDPGIRVVMKEFPILGHTSEFAARVSLVALKHGEFSAFHNGVYALDGRLDESRILAVAANLGLDAKTVRREMKAPAIDAALAANIALAKPLALDGTPTFIAGDVVIPGAMTLEDLEQAVASARKKG